MHPCTPGYAYVHRVQFYRPIGLPIHTVSCMLHSRGGAAVVYLFSICLKLHVIEQPTWRGAGQYLNVGARTQANSAFHPYGVGEWGPASAGTVSGWTWGVQVKLWDPLRTRALEVCSRRGAIQIHVYLYLTNDSVMIERLCTRVVPKGWLLWRLDAAGMAYHEWQSASGRASNAVTSSHFIISARDSGVGTLGGWAGPHGTW